MKSFLNSTQILSTQILMAGSTIIQLLAAVLALPASLLLADDAIDFNRDVRPIFNQHCVACHGGVKQAADLSFAYGEQVLPLVEPGQPDASYLIERVIAADDEERMPPPEHGRRLSEAEVQTLKEWIQQGAVWGEHWAFVAPQKIEPPVATSDTWSRSRIDRFILAALAQAGLTPSVETSPERWLRRVSLDLIGLPPTLDQREKFLAAVRTDGEAAYQTAVERLLQSPQFGERWASVWLDVVRYADSRGLGLDSRRTIWKYRDWVIKAFNADMPYDQFTIKQLAGDLLPEAQLQDRVATACQRLTQTNEEGGTDDEEFRTEAVIDRVNTTWQAWMGLSFGCAQCHSHPYEPIRHEEYYQFLAYFNNTVDCDLSDDKPTLAVPIDDREAQQAQELDRQIARLQLEDWNAAYPLLADDQNWIALKDIQATSNNSTRFVVVEVDGIEEFQTQGNVAKETTAIIEAPIPAGVTSLTALRFTGLPHDLTKALNNSEWGFVISHFQVELIEDANSPPEALEIARVVADEPHPLLDPQLSLKEKNSDGFGAYSRINHPRSAVFVLQTPRAFKLGSRLRVSLAQNVFELGAFPLVAKRGRLAISDRDDFTDWWMDSQRAAAREKADQLIALRRKIPSVDIPILAEREANFMRPTFVFDRGNFLTKSTAVYAKTPDFLPTRAASPTLVEPPQLIGIHHELASPSRLELARWIASENNPLTARVIVNRVWAQMFAAGLVESQEDFGSSGDMPSHPQLLDDLAARFTDEMDWSIKSLLREMVLCATYRQSSAATPTQLSVDPRNRWLSHSPKTRLPAETIRDQALAISGLLCDTHFGPPVHPPIPEGVWMPFNAGDKWVTPELDNPDRYRRTIYTYTKRTIPFPLLASFDAPSREFCAPRRLGSNTPLQALMTLNDLTFTEASAALAGRMLGHSQQVAEQIRFGILLATCRESRDNEVHELQQLYAIGMDGHPESHLESMTTVANVLLNLDEVLSKQ